MRIAGAQPEGFVDRGNAFLRAADIAKRLPEGEVALGEACIEPQRIAQVVYAALRLAAERPCPAERKMGSRLTVVERDCAFRERRRVGDPLGPLVQGAIPAELYMDIGKPRMGLGKGGLEIDRPLEERFGYPQILQIELVKVP